MQFKEKKYVIQKIKTSQRIDIIISDNRFGCFDSKTFNVFLSHQLNIKMPFLWLEKVVTFFNCLFIKKFDECWVPDFEAEPNLSGDLARNSCLKNIKYLGALSRMTHFNLEIKRDVIVVLSGPEPQRTVFENLILKQAQNLPLRFLIVQGRPEKMENRSAL